MNKVEELLAYNMILENDLWIPNKNPTTTCAYVENTKEENPITRLEEARKALEKFKYKEESLFKPCFKSKKLNYIECENCGKRRYFSIRFGKKKIKNLKCKKCKCTYIKILKLK